MADALENGKDRARGSNNVSCSHGQAFSDLFYKGGWDIISKDSFYGDTSPCPWFLRVLFKRQNSRRYLHQSRILPRFLPFSASYKGSWKFVGRERDGSVNIRLEFSEWELVSGHKILKSHWIEERALVVPRLNYTWWIYVCCLIFRGWLMGDGPPINLRKNQVQ